MKDTPYHPEADMLVLGGPPHEVALIAACRSDANRDVVDGLLLPSSLAFETPIESEGLPQHPMVVIRCYESIQMVMSPERLRALSLWMSDAADWLEDMIEEGL